MIFLILIIVVTGLVLPIASTVVGDVTKYAVEKYRGNDPKFDVTGTVESTLHNLAWSNLPAKLFGPLGDKVAKKCKFIAR